jgi:hypothetical protein
MQSVILIATDKNTLLVLLKGRLTNSNTDLCTADCDHTMYTAAAVLIPWDLGQVLLHGCLISTTVLYSTL